MRLEVAMAIGLETEAGATDTGRCRPSGGTGRPRLALGRRG